MERCGNILPKTGKVFPSTGPQPGPGLTYPAAIAGALENELGDTHRAIKTAMRWTGASERTIKNWYAGTHGPSGEHLVSLMMSQLSEDADLFAIFTDIFDPEGSEIYLKPVSDYVVTGKPVNFYTLLESARRRGETAIGYRLESESGDASKSYGVYTNPKKSEIVTFSPDDRLIVIAED